MSPISIHEFINHLRTRAFLVVVCLLALIITSPASAQDSALLRTTLLMDPSGQLGVDDMAAQTFKPVANPFSRGYTSAVAWVKLEVAPNAAPELVLMVRQANLDTVRLYSPSAQAPGWRVQQTGDQVAYSERARTEVNLALPLTPDATRPSVHYLRVTTAGAMVVSTKLLTPPESQSFEVLAHGFMGLYVGVMLLLLWLALVRWWLTRNVLWGLSAVFQAVTMVYMPFIMGFGANTCCPTRPPLVDIGVSLLGCLHLLAGGLFFLMIYRTYKAPRLAQAMYWLCIALFPVQMVLLATGKTMQAMSLNAYMLLLQTVWGMGAVWFLRIDDAFLRRLLRGTYLALTAYILYFMGPMVGITPNTELTLYPGLLTGIFVAVMQHVLLVRRAQLELREQQHLSQQILEVSEKLKWETARRAESNSFMRMLMHEIKNPLASIRIATQSLVSGRITELADQNQRLKNIQ